MGSIRVLVVDDERLARVSLADFLQEAGYEVVVAEDGATATRLQQERPFDVCIVDIRMPDMDGVETILGLRQLVPGSRFIVYTGSPQFTLPPTLKEIGLSERDIVRKPVLDMSVFVVLIDTEVDPEVGGQTGD